MGNKCMIYVACAGSGKSTKLVTQALNYSGDKKVLLTTFTDANRDELSEKIFKSKGYIPKQIEVLSWYQFVIRHLINPYMPKEYRREIKGVNFQSGASKIKKGNNKGNVKYFINDEGKIDNNRIADLGFLTIQKEPVTLNRLHEIFDIIMVDEFQDLSAYDFDLLKAIVEKGINVEGAGDPRQKTYLTSQNSKNKSAVQSFTKFLETNAKYKSVFNINYEFLNLSYRCHEDTIVVASKIYPEYEPSHSAKKSFDSHVYFVEKSNQSDFINQMRPTLLRYNSKTKINENVPFINYGNSKGKTFENTLIYPTNDLKNFLLHKKELQDSPISKSKYYVALTRASNVTGILIENGEYKYCADEIIKLWKPK